MFYTYVTRSAKPNIMVHFWKLIFMTVFEKSLLPHTKSYFNFIAQDNSYTQDLSTHSVSTIKC